MFLLLLSGSAGAFHKLSAAKERLVNVLSATSAAAAGAATGGGVLQRLAAIAARPGVGRIKVDSIPPPLGR